MLKVHSQKTENPASNKPTCAICGFEYNKTLGIALDSVNVLASRPVSKLAIAPNTEWSAIPEDWACPDCGAEKNLFLKSA